MSDQLVARPVPKYKTIQTQNKRIHAPNIHVLCGTGTHDPSFWASEDTSCLRTLGYSDRQWTLLHINILLLFSRKLSSVCYNRCHLRKYMFLCKLELLNIQNFAVKSRVSENHHSLQCGCILACTQTYTCLACLSKGKVNVVNTSHVSDLEIAIYIAANKF
jgi:hypothetical protein